MPSLAAPASAFPARQSRRRGGLRRGRVEVLLLERGEGLTQRHLGQLLRRSSQEANGGGIVAEPGAVARHARHFIHEMRQSLPVDEADARRLIQRRKEALVLKLE